MAVTSQLTLIEDMESAPTILSPGSGGGGSTNTDIFIEGNQSVGRRVDNATNKGVGVQVTAVDLSAADEHVVGWQWVTQWAAVSSNRMRLGDGTNNDDHTIPASYVPPLGGWVPTWVDVSRAPETGGSANEAAITDFVFLSNMANVGGAADNYIIDAFHHGTSGYLWDGSTGSFADFVTYENSNREGVLVELNGTIFCYARLELGSATATVFTDSGFNITFPDQSLVASTFMGLSVDLQNASTDIDLNDGTISSADVAAAGNRPDFLVTGTSGAFDTSGLTLLGMRQVTLTSACTIVGGIIDALDLTQGGASISGGIIRPRTATQVAMINDATFGVSTGIRDVTFEQAGSGHAIEITTPGTYNFQDIVFTGFGGTPGTNSTPSSGANDAAIYNNSGGAVTINVNGSGNQPSVRNAASSTTTVAQTVTVTIKCVDAVTGAAIQNARVNLGTTGVGSNDLISFALTDVNGEVSTSYGGSTPQTVNGYAAKGTEVPTYQRVAITGSISSSGLTQTVPMNSDD